MEIGVRLIPFNHKMRLARKQLGLTQAQLAECIGVSQSLIGAIERWRLPTTARGMDRLKQIALILGIELDDLFPESLRDLPQIQLCPIETVVEVESLNLLPDSQHLQLEDPNQLRPDISMMQKETQTAIHCALQTLPARERELLRLYFGLDGYRYNYDALSRMLGVSRERIHQLVSKTIEQLRVSDDYEFLKEYMP